MLITLHCTQWTQRCGWWWSRLRWWWRCEGYSHSACQYLGAKKQKQAGAGRTVCNEFTQNRNQKITIMPSNQAMPGPGHSAAGYDWPRPFHMTAVNCNSNQLQILARTLFLSLSLSLQWTTSMATLQLQQKLLFELGRRMRRSRSRSRSRRSHSRRTWAGCRTRHRHRYEPGHAAAWSVAILCQAARLLGWVAVCGAVQITH